MMTVAKYWESTSNKTKTLFSILAKKQYTFTLDNMTVTAIRMIARMKKKMS